MLQLSKEKQQKFFPANAYSIRQALVRLLTEKGILTDQQFVGSHVSSLIDLLAYTLQCLLFYLHRTSSEATFTEAQRFENLVKITRLLDYRPLGYQTAILNAILKVTQPELFSSSQPIYVLPRYSTFYVDQVPFSLAEDVTFHVQQDNENLSLIFYQGLFQEWLYEARGEDGEKVILHQPNLLIDFSQVDVYVWEAEHQKWFAYSEVPSLLLEFSNESRVFEKRLTPFKDIEITFGSSQSGGGRKLRPGDKIAIYYLVSHGNQEAIRIKPRQFETATIRVFGLTTPTYQEIFSNIYDQQAIRGQLVTPAQFAALQFSNPSTPILPTEAETVEQIRQNVPRLTKIQNRLVTKEDYHAFLTTRFSTFFDDLVVLNQHDFNNEYLSVLIKTDKIPLTRLPHFAHPCQFQNLTICALPKNSTAFELSPFQQQFLLQELQPLQMFGAEAQFVAPIVRRWAIGLIPPEIIKTKDSLTDFTESEILSWVASTRLEIFLAPQQVAFQQKVTIENYLLEKILDIFRAYLPTTQSHRRLGKTIFTDQIIQTILSLPQVQKIQLIQEQSPEIVWTTTSSSSSKFNNIRIENELVYLCWSEQSSRLLNISNQLPIVQTPCEWWFFDPRAFELFSQNIIFKTT